MKNSISLCVTSLFFLTIACAVHANNHHIQSLSDIKQFTKKELKDIQSRYEEYQTNKQLFTDSQFILIENRQLTSIITDITTHSAIKLDSTETLLDFAENVNDSGFTFSELEPRITRYIKNGDPPFAALRKAIEREKVHRWKLMQKQQVKNSNDMFVKKMNALDLSPIDREKTISSYAVCIKPFSNATDRIEMMTPRICGPIDEYPSPRHVKRSVHIPEMTSLKETPRLVAYRELINEAKNIAETHSLNTFEKVLMAKCIAEQSLRFFVPAHHPIKAVNKTCKLHKKTPDKVFFMHTGVCGNFSAIAYNVASALGLAGNIFLVRHHVHMYLELKQGGNWYHSHPFNSKSKCDLIRF